MPTSKIISVRATPVTVPTKRPCAWSFGVSYGFTRTILELTSDDGRVGLGECEGSGAADLLSRRLGPKLIGLPAHDMAAAWRLCHMDLHDHGCLSDPGQVKAYAAIEMAMWDLLGKAAGKPVFELLGGAVRPRAEFGAYGYSFVLSPGGLAEEQVPEAMAAQAKQSVARSGARVFEFKVGRYSAATDVAAIRAVRKALGDAAVMGADANQALDFEGSRRLMRAAAEAGLGWFEEPVSTLGNMVRLYREFHVPISSHCTEMDTVRFYPEIAGIVGDVHVQGGIRGMMRSAAAFRAMGHQFWLRSSFELGISWAAMVHVGISCPDLTRASQSLVDYIEDDLVTGPAWLLEAGGVVPPHRPGLGVELDRDALERYAGFFRSHGELDHFGSDQDGISAPLA